MHPPTKDQTDIGLDNPTLDCSDDIDMARQEFKDESDIHYMLQRFGLVQPRGAPTYGVWDDSIELQTALASTRQAQTAFKQLPPDLQQKVGSIENLVNAALSGAIEIKNEPAPSEPAPSAPAPPQT